MSDIDISVGIAEDEQESSFMNATLQSFGERSAISIAIHLPEGIGDGIDPNSEREVRSLLAGLFSSAIARGCRVEVQLGPNRDSSNGADDEGDDEPGD